MIEVKTNILVLITPRARIVNAKAPSPRGTRLTRLFAEITTGSKLSGCREMIGGVAICVGGKGGLKAGCVLLSCSGQLAGIVSSTRTWLACSKALEKACTV